MSIEWAKLVAETFVSWPVAAVIVSIIFRKFLVDFLPNITKAKVGPIEIERQLASVKQDTELLKKINELLVENERLKMEQLIAEAEETVDENKSSMLSRSKDLLMEITRLMGGI